MRISFEVDGYASRLEFFCGRFDAMLCDIGFTRLLAMEHAMVDFWRVIVDDLTVVGTKGCIALVKIYVLISRILFRLIVLYLSQGIYVRKKNSYAI